MKQSLLTQGHMINVGAVALDIIQNYTKTWMLLNAFDEDRLIYPHFPHNEDILINYEQIQAGITELKANLYHQREDSQFFGRERDEAFQQVWGTVH